ncbi:hypothetical protein [Vibrio ostreicida]|uniref:hypothetical protein n=1 Tax=Vibrio ostreicida TaxID=526588 RepID=UPI0009710410|nr:hypothetical protein [Vibrio ostreicida]
MSFCLADTGAQWVFDQSGKNPFPAPGVTRVALCSFSNAMDVFGKKVSAWASDLLAGVGLSSFSKAIEPLGNMLFELLTVRFSLKV